MKAELDTATKQLVKRFGRDYQPTLLPADIERGPVGMCFDWNALQAARLYPKYQYVEGIATHPEEPTQWVLHAWLTDGTHAFDPTWDVIDNTTGKHRPVPSRYIGIVMPIRAVATFMRVTGYQGVLANRWRLPDMVEDMLKMESVEAGG
jgi:hypothetical protein